MTEEKPDPKLGAGHASAMFRQGLAELRAALYPESNVAQPPQGGIYGTLTPGEVMQERGTWGGASLEGGRDSPQAPTSGEQREEEVKRDGPESERD